MHTVVSTVNIPDALMPATASSSLKSQWTVLTAQCAVDLLKKASMDVPQELLEASLPTSLPRSQRNAWDADHKGSSGDVDVDGSRRQRQRRERGGNASGVSVATTPAV